MLFGSITKSPADAFQNTLGNIIPVLYGTIYFDFCRALDRMFLLSKNVICSNCGMQYFKFQVKMLRGNGDEILVSRFSIFIFILPFSIVGYL